MKNHANGELDSLINEINGEFFAQTMFDEFHKETLENLVNLRTEVNRIKDVLDYQIVRMEIRYKKIY